MRVQKLNFWLIIVTLATTLGYAGFCLWQVYTGKPVGQNIESVLPLNPRLMIGLCWAAATVTLLFLPEFGRIISAVCFVAVLWTFGSWWSATALIKANVEDGRIAGPTGFVGNLLIGAHPIDLVIAALTLFVLVLDVVLIYNKFILRTNRQHDASALPPAVAHK
jgi:hypothetical protein